jgi:hypothetical protein
MATPAEIRCLDNFINEVTQELTVSCQLPYNIPKKEIARIIERAKQWFYKHYEYSVEEKFLALTPEEYNKNTEAFRKNGEITLPNAVWAVNAVFQLSRFSGEDGGFSNYSFNSSDTDFAVDKMVYNSYYGGGEGIASENLMYFVINEYFIDSARQVLQNAMSYTFNYLNHKFRFLGEKPDYTVVFQVYTKLDDCSLFGDEIFLRYVVARCKQQLARVMGTFNYNLPGGITINYDLYKSEGDDEIAAITEEIKTDEGTDYFFTA